MSFTVTELRDALRSATGRDISDGDAALAYVRIDQNLLRRRHQGRVRWEPWDGESMVGAARPVDIRARPDYGGGEIYLVWVDDELVYLQPHDPQGIGYEAITKDELQHVASQHCRAIVDELVFVAALNEAIQGLPPEPAQPVQVFTEPPPMSPFGRA